MNHFAMDLTSDEKDKQIAALREALEHWRHLAKLAENGMCHALDVGDSYPDMMLALRDTHYDFLFEYHNRFIKGAK